MARISIFLESFIQAESRNGRANTPDCMLSRNEFNDLARVAPYRQLRNEFMSTIVIGSGLICAAALAMGFGYVIPVGTTIGGLFDLVGIASGMLCFGLVEGKQPDALSRAPPPNSDLLDE
jgi:hypothetical protein